MLIYLLGLIGSAVFAVSGALAAGQKGFDWVGVFLIALVTALGGGTVRDVLLDREVFWITEPAYVWVTLVAAALTLLYAHKVRPPYKALLVADALGLSMFSIIGTRIAESYDVAFIIAVLMGTTTGVVGGVIRDILVNEVPLLCRPTQPIYSTAAAAGIVCYIGLSQFGLPTKGAIIAGVFVIASLRLAAMKWNLRLPEFRPAPEL